jgi:pantoate--beta-alanine ligase
MGYLHEGHQSLIRKSVEQNDRTVVSVFVNPIQFGPTEDLEAYPRDINRDMKAVEEVGGDLIFNPEPAEMYPGHFTSFIDTTETTELLCGAVRPIHFRGVCTVVGKLFNIVQPDRAYFGEKDFQQLAIIHYMVERSELKNTFGRLQIVDCPIVREASGLALSSRNERLSADEKQTALGISRTLIASLEWAKNMSVEQVRQRVVDTINAIEGLEVEYYEIVAQSTLQPTGTFTHAIGCVTVYCGPVRLIDNIKYN